MTLSSLSVTQRTAPQQTFDSNKVRSLIAEYLGIDVKRVTDETHFSEFGIDRYDRLELMILIEDAFIGVEITDNDEGPPMQSLQAEYYRGWSGDAKIRARSRSSP